MNLKGIAASLLLFSVSSCIYMPSVAPYVHIQDTVYMSPDKISTIKTASDLLSLSQFSNITRLDKKHMTLVYNIREKTESVTLQPGMQKFKVSYDDILYHKSTYITVKVDAGITYTVNYKRENRKVFIWVVNNSTGLLITDKIIL